MNLGEVTDIEKEGMAEDIKLYLIGAQAPEPSQEELDEMVAKCVTSLNMITDSIQSLKKDDWQVDEDNEVKSAYIGTALTLAPSGKIYTFWTSNQTPQDEAMDSALDRVLQDRDISLYASEGCTNDWMVEVDTSEEDNDDWKDEPRDKDYNDYTEEDNEFWRNIPKEEE